MRISFDNTPKDTVLTEADGTLTASFMATGYIKSISRIRFSKGLSPSIGAFSITEAGKKDGSVEGETTPSKFALVFVSELDGAEKISIVERFESERDAEVALKMVHDALISRTRTNRIKSFVRTIAFYGFIPLMVFVFLASVMRTLDARNTSNEIMAGLISQAGVGNGGQGASADAFQAPARVTPRAEPALKDTDFAKHGIRLGLATAPATKTLYVFSDPNCPACKAFEAEMKKLSTDYAIYVFPVAFKSGSDKLAAKALCAKDQAKKWDEIMALPVGSTTDGDESCALAASAVTENMQAFTSLGFNTTPTIVVGDGHVFGSDHVPNADDVRAYSKGAK